MKKVALTGLAALTLLDISAGTAAAQWTGPYIGLHAGYRWGDVDLTAPAYTFPDGLGGIVAIPARFESYTVNGGIIGGHVGFNAWLIPGTWLAGIEADLSAGWGDDNKTAGFISSDGVVATRTSTVELGLQGTVRARLGFVSGAWMFYGTAGIAFIHVEWTDAITTPFVASSVSKSDVLTGYTVGGGIELALSQTTLVRGEYLYEDFGSMSVPLAFTTQTGSLDVVAHKLRVGISVKF